MLNTARNENKCLRGKYYKIADLKTENKNN